MSINANYLVALPPRTIRGGSADLETNGMVLVASDLIPADKPALVFETAQAVAGVFGASSDVTRFAQQYFSGINNQQHIPSALVIGADLSAARAAWLRSAPISATLAELKAITDGTLTLEVNGTQIAATEIDLSSATSLSAVAEAIAAKVDGVSGAYNSDLNAIILTTATTGASASIGYASGTIAEAIGFTLAAGAVLSQGTDAQTPAENFDAICEVTRNWTQFTTLAEVTNEEKAKAYAAWADIDDDYVYIFWTSDSRVLSALTAENTIAYALIEDFNCALPFYTAYATSAAAVLAYPASIAWDREQGMKVLFGKGASGVPAEVTSQDVAAVLDANKVSYVGEFATRNAKFVFFNRGALTGNLYGFYDALIGLIWLRAKIQRLCMDGFSAVNRVPYTQKGYSLIEAWISDAVRAGKKNGAIDVGVTLSDSQRAQIMQEVGKDITDELFAKGWYLDIQDPDASVRAQRGSPVMTFYFTYSGSVQKVEMPVTSIQ